MIRVNVGHINIVYSRGVFTSGRIISEMPSSPGRREVAVRGLPKYFDRTETHICNVFVYGLQRVQLYVLLYYGVISFDCKYLLDDIYIYLWIR